MLQISLIESLLGLHLRTLYQLYRLF